MAKAYGYAVQAMEGAIELINNPTDHKLNYDFPITTILKISNLVDPDQAKHFQQQNFQQILNDIASELQKLAEIKDCKIIQNGQSGYGANLGEVFAILQTKKDSEKILEEFIDKKYLGKKIKVVCVPEESYNEYFKKLFDK